jgi:serine protease Do
MRKNKRLTFVLLLLIITIVALYLGKSHINISSNTSSVVKIVVYSNNNNYANSEGSGVAVSPNLILTNYHVVKYPKKIMIINNGNKSEARLKAYDLKSDLAILETSINLTPLKFSSDEVKVGNKVKVLHKERVEVGYIDDTMQSIPDYLGSLFKYIKIKDVNTEHGSSGGAVLNRKGEIIGIISARVKENDLVYTYAIPSKDAMPIVNRLINGETYKHITLGIEAREISLGLLVENVYNNSLAYGKLKKGDIIQKLNESSIRTSHDLLYQLFIAQEYKNSEIIIDILREEQTTKIRF